MSLVSANVKYTAFIRLFLRELIKKNEEAPPPLEEDRGDLGRVRLL
jgi:hypothetical protein